MENGYGSFSLVLQIKLLVLPIFPNLPGSRGFTVSLGWQKAPVAEAIRGFCKLQELSEADVSSGCDVNLPGAGSAGGGSSVEVGDDVL